MQSVGTRAMPTEAGPVSSTSLTWSATDDGRAAVSMSGFVPQPDPRSVTLGCGTSGAPFPCGAWEPDKTGVVLYALFSYSGAHGAPYNKCRLDDIYPSELL